MSPSPLGISLYRTAFIQISSVKTITSLPFVKFKSDPLFCKNTETLWFSWTFTSIFSFRTALSILILTLPCLFSSPASSFIRSIIPTFLIFRSILLSFFLFSAFVLFYFLTYHNSTLYPVIPFIHSSFTTVTVFVDFTTLNAPLRMYWNSFYHVCSENLYTLYSPLFHFMEKSIPVSKNYDFFLFTFSFPWNPFWYSDVENVSSITFFPKDLSIF